MNYEFEVEKLKGWKVYYTNMHRKTGRNVYYDNLRKIMIRFADMRARIITKDLSGTDEPQNDEEHKKLYRFKEEMDKQIEEIRVELQILNLVFAC